MADAPKTTRTGTEFRSRRDREADLSNLVFGKVPPQSRDLEEAVLGAIMLDKDALPMVLEILNPESFYVDAHQEIFKAMLSLFEHSKPIDLLTVTEELKRMGKLEGIGGPYQLVELTNRVASSANIEFHARIVAQKFIQRELIRVSNVTIRDAYEDSTDVFDLLDNAEAGLFKITQTNISKSYEPIGALSGLALKQIEELSKKEDGLTGVPTGFRDLDLLTSGWQPSDLIILAGRPGMGKTSLATNVACNIAQAYVPDTHADGTPRAADGGVVGNSATLPPVSSRRSAASWLPRSARSAALSPAALRNDAFAPRRNNSATTEAWPLRAAQCSGVEPSSARASTTRCHKGRASAGAGSRVGIQVWS